MTNTLFWGKINSSILFCSKFVTIICMCEHALLRNLLKNYAIGDSISSELAIVSEFINHEKLMTKTMIIHVAF